jgi:hypothetical protein
VLQADFTAYMSGPQLINNTHLNRKATIAPLGPIALHIHMQDSQNIAAILLVQGPCTS